MIRAKAHPSTGIKSIDHEGKMIPIDLDVTVPIGQIYLFSGNQYIKTVNLGGQESGTGGQAGEHARGKASSR